MITRSPIMTDREREEFDQEKVVLQLQIDAQLEMKRLELDILKQENKAWLRIPLTIIKLPVICIMAVGLAVTIARGKPVPEDFWKSIR